VAAAGLSSASRYCHIICFVIPVTQIPDIFFRQTFLAPPLTTPPTTNANGNKANERASHMLFRQKIKSKIHHESYVDICLWFCKLWCSAASKEHQIPTYIKARRTMEPSFTKYNYGTSHDERVILESKFCCLQPVRSQQDTYIIGNCFQKRRIFF
jgi:hypothetical protein